MYSCPECLNEMIHQNSHVLDDEILLHEFHCQDCLIDLQKQILIGDSDEDV